MHGWDYRYDTGTSEDDNAERLARFRAWVENDADWVDEDVQADHLEAGRWLT